MYLTILVVGEGAEKPTLVDGRVRLVKPTSLGADAVVARRYRLLRPLGHGGMGRVWLAEDELLARQVALKQVAVGDRASERAVRWARGRVLTEARAAARINHRGVVTILDVVVDGGEPWIVMERLTGRTLAQSIGADGPLPFDRVVYIGLSLVDVLREVHRAGLVHCDVKPANVYLCRNGRVVLTDFGIAHRSGEKNRTPAGSVTGSPAYLAPERILGHDIGPAADMFALGVTLFAAVEGWSPFNRASVSATLAAVVEDDPAPFLRAGPLRPVIEGMLAKRPEQRPGIERARAALLAAGG